MKILLVSEGIHELSGALEKLAERLFDPLSVQFESEKFSSPQIRINPGKGSKILKRAVRWLLEAERREFDGAVVVIDEDGEAIRRQDFERAQAEALGVRRRAFGVAIRTFDAWMLADETALSIVLGRTIQTLAAPEEIVDAKSEFKKLVAGDPTDEWMREIYARIAADVRLESLEKKCKRGFAPFAERVRAMA